MDGRHFGRISGGKSCAAEERTLAKDLISIIERVSGRPHGLASRRLEGEVVDTLSRLVLVWMEKASRTSDQGLDWMGTDRPPCMMVRPMAGVPSCELPVYRPQYRFLAPTKVEEEVETESEIEAEIDEVIQQLLAQAASDVSEATRYLRDALNASERVSHEQS